jgi:hypothetical protein
MFWSFVGGVAAGVTGTLGVFALLKLLWGNVP